MSISRPAPIDSDSDETDGSMDSADARSLHRHHQRLPVVPESDSEMRRESDSDMRRESTSGVDISADNADDLPASVGTLEPLASAVDSTLVRTNVTSCGAVDGFLDDGDSEDGVADARADEVIDK